MRKPTTSQLAIDTRKRNFSIFRLRGTVKQLSALNMPNETSQEFALRMAALDAVEALLKEIKEPLHG